VVVGADDAETSPRRVRFTERLRLEPIDRDHVDDLLVLHQDPDVAEYWGAWSREQARTVANLCEQAWNDDGVSKWLAYDRAETTIVGRGGLSRVMVDGELRVEVGWTLLGARRGHGFATEIGRAGIDFAFDELDAEEVVAFTETTNGPSRAVMERLGMTDPRPITHNDEPFVLYVIRRGAGISTATDRD
jgi:[ribosomal protein S5]-alanine N-acetyltransferase